MFKLVIVEDEDIIRKNLVLAMDWLVLDCVVVGEAENGRRGLKVILEERPQIVITDIKMPVMNGMDMLTEAMGHVSFAAIILSGFGEFEYARQALRLGVVDYVLKPVDESLLEAAVRKAVYSLGSREPLNISEKIPKPPSLFSVGLEAMPAGSSLPVLLALQRIRTAYADKLNVEALAEEIGVSSSYLHRKIKEETGLTFLHLLHRHRIREAIARMQSKALRIHEVSAQVGFGEYKHFCSVFKKITGVSPTDFMRSQELR